MTAIAANGRAPRVPTLTPEPAHSDGMQLAAAVLRVQAAVSKLRSNADGHIGSRSYRYVTLDAVVDEVLPLLVSEELLWRAAPTIHEDGQPALRYRMTHVPSGETDEDVMPLLGCTDSQALGSATTYDRRYALTAYLNLTVDDDDGAGASVRAPVDHYAEAEAAHNAVQNAGEANTSQSTSQPTAAPSKSTGRPATAKQRTMIEARARAIDLTADEFANVIKVAAGEERVTWQDGAAERWSKRALDRLPAKLVDAVLEGIKAKAGEGA
jgi:hypothetical protein